MPIDSSKNEKSFPGAKDKIDVSQKVLEQIKTRKIKITERWVWWAKKLGLKSGLVLAFVLIIIIINLILYYFQKNGGFNYLSFGLPSVALIFYNIPFALIALIIILSLIYNYLIKKTDLVFNKYYRISIILVGLITLASGLFLYFTGINQALEKVIAKNQNKIFLLSEIYRGQIPCLSADHRGVIGRVTEKTNNTVTIKTLNNQKIIIISAPAEQLEKIYEDQIIGAIGVGGDDIFVANKVKVITSDFVVQCLGEIK